MAYKQLSFTIRSVILQTGFIETFEHVMLE
jgi:hypothetical protein